MLTTDLLLTRSRGAYIEPRYIDIAVPSYTQLAADLIALFGQHQGQPRKTLQTALDAYAGDSTDYRVQRGLAKLPRPCV